MPSIAVQVSCLLQLATLRALLLPDMVRCERVCRRWRVLILRSGYCLRVFNRRLFLPDLGDIKAAQFGHPHVPLPAVGYSCGRTTDHLMQGSEV